MVGHNHEVVQGESSGPNAGTKNIDEERSVAVRLEKTLAHPGLSCDKEGAVGFDDVFWIGVAGECGHGGTQGLKARFYCGGSTARLKPCPFTFPCQKQK